ncbi:serine hydrolase domain-containing protein [Paenibacillus sp. GCM10027629]|uniref:serine hydrolase domain-containing protein n=1 Tax=Paenibacillus sp. GCM10027629 TaxID=3273414 RepID=UPI003642217C
MKKEQTEAAITELFCKKVHNDSKIQHASLLVHSDRLGIHLNLAEGRAEHHTIHPQQPFYIASISKLFTSVLIGMLVEKGQLAYEDPISRYLDEDLLHQLHFYKGKDYTSEIQIKHLLNHTSGLHCFFEDQPKQGKSMINLIVDEPERTWTPQEALLWAKAHLHGHFPPGKGFHYSDTGYHLLGLIIEKVTSLPYHDVLHIYIFAPLSMYDSYVAPGKPMRRSEYPLARLFVRHIDVTDYNSISFMYAGGGIVSTTEDLLRFMRALVRYELVSVQTIDTMMRDWARFFPGIDYGYGVMRFRAIPLLMPAKYHAWGNAGSTGSFMFYHPATDAYLIGSMNQFRYHQKGIRLMMQTIDKLLKCDA